MDGWLGMMGWLYGAGPGGRQKLNSGIRIGGQWQADAN